jgi:uncharacterized protein YceK
MKRKQPSTVLAGLLAVALALSGCKSMNSTDDAAETGGSTLGSSTAGSWQTGADSKTGMSDKPMGTSGSSGASGAMGSGTAGVQKQEGATSMPNSTVLAIEPVPKSAAATGAVGSSGASGTTGGSGAGEAYRITLRLDDGSTQVLTQDTIPDFRSGDRVHVESGVIHR